MKKVSISNGNHKRIKKLIKCQGITMFDMVDTAIKYYLMKLESQVSMQPEKVKESK